MSFIPPRNEKEKEYLEDLSLKNHKLQKDLLDTAVAELNKIIFVLATGTFILSISFIGYLKTEIVWPWLLIASWVCFAGALFCNIFAHLVTYTLSDKRLTAINNSRSSGFQKDWDVENREDITKWKKKGKTVNYAVFIFLAAGILLLLIFGAGNLLALNH